MYHKSRSFSISSSACLFQNIPHAQPKRLFNACLIMSLPCLNPCKSISLQFRVQVVPKWSKQGPDSTKHPSYACSSPAWPHVSSWAVPSAWTLFLLLLSSELLLNPQGSGPMSLQWHNLSKPHLSWVPSGHLHWALHFRLYSGGSPFNVCLIPHWAAGPTGQALHLCSLGITNQRLASRRCCKQYLNGHPWLK